MIEMERLKQSALSVAQKICSQASEAAERDSDTDLLSVDYAAARQILFTRMI